MASNKRKKFLCLKNIMNLKILSCKNSIFTSLEEETTKGRGA